MDVQPGLLDGDMWRYPRGWSTAVKCNWRAAAEKGFDPSHAYIHRNSAFITDYKVPFVLGDAGITRDHGMEIVEKANSPMGVVLKRGGSTGIWQAEVSSGVNVSSRFRPGAAGGVDGRDPAVSI